MPNSIPNLVCYDNVWARFSGDNQEEAWTLLSYRPAGYYFSPKYKAGHWDGFIRLLNWKTGLFPAGLVPYLQTEFAKRQLPLSVSDQRGEYPTHEEGGWWGFHADLMAHQQAAVDICVQAERGVIEHPVAAGKSWTEIALTTALSVPTLLLTHRKDLLLKFYGGRKAPYNEGFIDLTSGASVGIIGDGVWQSGLITVAMFQSLWSALNRRHTEAVALLQQTRCVIVDEGHHIPAKTFETVMKLMPNARYRFAFSATPFKSQGDEEALFRVMAWTGPIIHRVTPEEGVAIGRLVPADIFFIRPTWQQPISLFETMTDQKGRTKPRLAWQEEYQVGIVANEGRNWAIYHLAQRFREAGPVLILVDRLDHGQLLAERLNCPFLQGDTALQERVKSWGMFRTGALDCVVASRIADEGVDIPGIQFLILAGGGKARHVLIQRIGRGMRASNEKEKVYVIDFEDTSPRLAKQTKERVGLYRDQPSYTLIETTAEEVLS